MKTKSRMAMFAIVPLLGFTAGCKLTEDKGTSVVGSVTTTPPDFTVQPPTEGTQGNTPVTEVPQVVTPPQTPPPNGSLFDLVSLKINGDALRTKEALLNLELVAPPYTLDSMKIGFDPACADGQWEPYNTNAQRVANKLNQPVSVSVRYKDYDATLSPCIVKSIVHDNQGPQIVFSRAPNPSIEQGSTASLLYSVTDLSPIASVSCSLNQLTKPCEKGANEVLITALPEGAYTFTIVSEDELGNTSTQSASWNVVSTVRRLQQSIQINDYRMVDILVVADNSGSMSFEQKSMAKRVGNFLSILQGLDWRIAVTTTDPILTSSVNTTNTNVPSGLQAAPGATRPYTKVSDGLFLPIYGLPGEFYLTSAMNPTDAQYRLGMTIQRPEVGSGLEQAINSTHRTIERATLDGNNNPVQKNFFRDGASFAVLVISDEDESGSGPKNSATNLINLVQTSFGGQKAFSWHSIITKPRDENCLYSQGATYGQKYHDFSVLTGGLIGSVCESDYAAQLSGIAGKIRQLVKTISLTCQPLPQFPISVSKNGQPYSGTYVVEGINLNFTDELPPGNYTVEHTCLK